jgi:hypothetical protein
MPDNEGMQSLSNLRLFYGMESRRGPRSCRPSDPEAKATDNCIKHIITYGDNK